MYKRNFQTNSFEEKGLPLPKLIKIHGAFLSEPKKAYRAYQVGHPNDTSIPFLTAKIHIKPLVTQADSFGVLVIGGSNYTNAICKKTGNGLIIKKVREKKNFPGSPQ